MARARGVPAAVVSASHNPFGDNGIKLFSAQGTKLPVEIEHAIEKELDALMDSPEHPPARPSGSDVGIIVADPKAAGEYRHGVIRALKGRRLDGLHVVLDCANGAASAVAPAVFESLGARVEVVFDQPDGVNINDGCGSTHPGALSSVVLQRGASLGLAFDGDADRLVAVDHRGAVAELDGPQVALAAVDRLQDQLAGYHAYHATRADLLRRLDQSQQARAAYDQAIELAGNTAETASLTRRRDQLQ